MLLLVTPIAEINECQKDVLTIDVAVRLCSNYL